MVMKLEVSMADLSYREANNKIRGKTDWAAVWAGVFTFAAIWSIFEVLGVAILASSNTTGATGINPGLATWTIVLSLIAMYVAGRETAHLGVFEDRHDGLVHGIIMFGLSVAALLVIGALGSGTNGNSLNSYMSSASPVMRWTAFGSLFLGWLGAMSGAASASMRRMKPADNVRDIRPAA
jgi:hypothetical protein